MSISARTRTVTTSAGRVVECFEDFVNIPCQRRHGAFSVKIEHARPGVQFPLASLRTSILGGHEPESVTYSRPTRWRRLSEDDTGTWMTDLPIEQAQMRAQTAVIRGRSCLVLGLGLGIAARLIARQVERVVVVERSPDVIALVAPSLTEKNIEVVEGDAWKIEEGRYGWVFADIWQSDSEDTFHHVVVPLRQKLVKRGVAPALSRVICWNEDVMRGQLELKITTCARLALSEHFPDFTLEDLIEPDNSVYHDFALPYYNWIAEARPEAEAAQIAGRRFVELYATSMDWLKRWRDTI